MTREEKNTAIQELTDTLQNNKNIYVADISGLDADATSRLRRLCFNKQVTIQVVKNTLLRKAMENSGMEFGGIYEVLKGNSSIMISETGNAPAKVIQEFRKKADKPVFKAAYVEEAIYIGEGDLDALINLKSREELIGDVVLLLQSPAKNVVSGLKSAGGTLAGILKTLQERGEN